MIDEPIVIVPYDPRWPELFEEERIRIEQAIGPWTLEIEHVGSTAVFGLAAKPVIDIMVGVRSLEDSPVLVERLSGIGYRYMPELERVFPLRRYFQKRREGRRTHQIHLVERSNSEWWERHVLFRDYLRGHPEAAEEYARLKRELAGRFREDREAYTRVKTEFIHGCVHREERDERT